jgi:hypothetical protein
MVTKLIRTIFVGLLISFSCYSQKGGTVDFSFQSNDILGSSQISFIKFQNEKLLLARRITLGFEIVRYSTDGKMDPTFKPIMLTYFLEIGGQSPVYLYKIQVLKNNQIAISTNFYKNSNGVQDGGLMIFDPDGTRLNRYLVEALEFEELPDGGFYTYWANSHYTYRVDKLGNVQRDPPFFNSDISHIIIQKDGRPILFEESLTYATSTAGDFTLKGYARLLSNGLIDTSLAKNPSICCLKNMEQMEDSSLTGIGNILLSSGQKPYYTLRFDKNMNLLDSVRIKEADGKIIGNWYRSPDHSYFIDIRPSFDTLSTRNYLKFNWQGKRDTTFAFNRKIMNPELGEIDMDSQFYYLTTSTESATKNQKFLTRLNKKGQVDSSFLFYQFAATPTSAIVLKNGKVLYEGTFITPRGQRQLIKVHENGLGDTTFHCDSFLSSFVAMNAVLELSNSDLLVSADYTDNHGNPASLLLRLNPNGTRDTTFKSPYFNGSISSLLQFSNQKIFVGGYVYSYNGVPVPTMSLIDQEGNLDQSFATTMSAQNAKFVKAAQHSNGDVYVITKMASSFQVYVLDGNGIKSSYPLTTSLSILSVLDAKITSSQQLVLLVSFSQSGTTKESVIVIDQNGTQLSSFNSAITINFYSYTKSLLLELQDDEKILLHNPNNTDNLVPKTFRLDKNGAIDPSFDCDYLYINQAYFLKKYDHNRFLFCFQKSGLSESSAYWNNPVMRLFNYPPEIVLANSTPELPSSKSPAFLYPNPTRDEVMVSLSLGKAPVQVFLYSSLGIEVWTGSLLDVSQKMSLSQLPRGLYFYEIRNLDNKKEGSGKLLLW